MRGGAGRRVAGLDTSRVATGNIYVRRLDSDVAIEYVREEFPWMIERKSSSRSGSLEKKTG